MPKQQTTAPAEDLYPGVTNWQFDKPVEDALRKNGVNVTSYLSQFDKAVQAKDFSTKAQLLNQFADMTDKVQGGTAARNWLQSQSPVQAKPEASVGAVQAVYGTIKNGFLDMAEAIPQLAVAGDKLLMASRGAPLDVAGWTKAQKGVEDVFKGMKTYVSENYTKPLATYDEKNGVDFDINLDNTIGFMANAAQYVLPGMLIGKGAQISARAALKGTQALTAEALAAQSAYLAEAGRTATTLTGISSFLQTFPLYQREAMANGANVAEATLFAMPVAALNSVIETANMPGLMKSLGLTAKETQKVLRRYTDDALQAGLRDIAGKPLSADMLMEVAEGASKQVLGAIRDPKALSAYAKLMKGGAGKVAKGFIEQGVPEMGEEFLQAGVENFAKLVFNNLKDKDKTGKFEDPTWSSFAYDAIYGMAGALVIGTGMGTFVNSKQADPTVYGVVAANVRQAQRKGLPLDELLDPDGPQSLPVFKALKAQLQKGDIDQEQFADISGKIGRMAKIAEQFSGIDTFSDQDTYTMFKVDESRNQATQAAQEVQGIRQSIDEINTQLQGNVTGGERIKLELERNGLTKRLGPQVDTPNGPAYAEELRATERMDSLEGIIGQVMDKYSEDAPRDAIRGFAEDKLSKWSRDYQTGKTYPDDFTPVQLLENPDTQQTLVTDGNGRIFRQLQTKGGNVVEPMKVDAEGNFTPSKREPISYDMREPVADVNEHISLYDRVRDPADPLKLQPYKEPDNSEEAGWLSDGEDIALRLEASPVKYTKDGVRNKNQSTATRQAEMEAMAYLNASGFLADKPGYKKRYEAVAARLTQLAIPPVAIQPVTADNAQVIGGEVDLLQDGNDPFTQTEQAPVQPQADTGTTDTFLDELTNQQPNDSTPDSPFQSMGATAPAASDLQSDYDETLQGITQEQQREKDLDAAIASGGTDIGAITRLVESLEQAATQPAEAAQPDRTQSGNDGEKKLRKPSLRESWDSLAPEEQATAVELANKYLSDIRNPDDFTTSAWSIYQWNGGNGTFKVKRSSFVQFADENVISQPLAQTYFSETGLGIDQIAEGANVTEQDVVDFMITYPRGEESVRSDLRNRYDSEFQAVTGRMLTKSTAAVVQDLAGDMALPGGSEEVSEESRQSAEQIMASVDAADMAVLQEFVGEYMAQYGEDWMLQLIQNPPGFPPIPQVVEQLIADAVANANFDTQNQEYQNVRNYLEQATGNTQSQPTTSANGLGSDNRGTQAAAAAEPVERPTPDALRNAADVIERQGQNEPVDGPLGQDQNVGELILGEVEQQINSVAASDPRTTEATARFDIEIAGLQKTKDELQRKIDSRNQQAFGNLFPEVARNGNQKDLLEGQVSADDVRRAAEKANTRDQQIIDVIDKQIADQQAKKLRAIEQAVLDGQQSLFPSGSDQKKEIAGSGGILRQELQRLANLPTQQISDKYGLSQEYGVRYIERLGDIVSNSGLSPDQIQSIEDRLSAGGMIYEDISSAFGIDQNTVAGSEDMSFLMDRNNDKTLPSLLRSVKELNRVPDTPQFNLPPTSLRQNVVGNRVLQQAIDQLAEAFPNVPIVANVMDYENALQQSGSNAILNGRRPKGFYWKGKVYLDPTVAGADTAVHEFGHIWADVAETTFPELFNKGVELVRDSKYYQSLLRDAYYRNLSPKELDKEALAQAIGDKGAQFITQGRKTAFGSFLSDIWNGIKRLLGLNPSVNVQDMTLDEFVRQATNQILSGEVNDNLPLSVNRQRGEVQQAAQFQLGTPPMNGQAKTVEDLKNEAIASLSTVPTGVSVDILTRGAARWTTRDKAYIASVKANTGYELIGKNRFKWTRPQNFFYTVDGGGVLVNPAEIGATAETSFMSAWNAAGNKGWLFRQLFDRLKGNTNLNTFISYLDDAKGSIRSLIQDVQRESGRKADFVQITLKGLRETAEAKLAPFSRLSGNSAETVKTMTIKSYDYDEDGNVQEVEKEVPVAVGMSLALLTKTQYKSYGTASHVAEVRPKAEDLYIDESTGNRTRKTYGAYYTDPDTGATTQFLLSKAESDALIERFETGAGAYSGETAAFTALEDYFNNKDVADTLEEEANQLNPDREFKRVDDNYFPISTVKDGSDAKNQSRNRQQTLEENRRLIEREGPAVAVLAQDPVSVMRQYDNAITDVIAYGRLVDNLGHLKDALSTKYQGEKKEAITQYLQSRIENLQNHRAKTAKQYEENPGLRILDTIMRRYGRAVLNSILSPFKQTITFASAKGLNGMIDDKFLNDSSVLGILTSLTAGAYRDVTARGDIDITGNTDRGYVGVGGLETLEKPFIDKLIGRDITDPAERLAHLKRWATVINRLIGSPTQFVDGAQFDDFGLNTKTLTNAQKKLRQLDQWADNYLSTGNQRADRAVVFAWIKAAELQGQSKGFSGSDLDSYTADLVTNALYEKYSLSNLAERTPMQLSDSFFLKMLGLYSSQQQKIGNLLLRAANEWIRTDPNSPEGISAKEHLYGVLSWAVMFNAIGVATISALSRALMAALSGKEPDDIEEIVQQVGWDTLRNVTGLFPNMGTAAANYLISTNDTINSGGRDSLVSMPAVDTIQQGLDALTQAKTALLEEDEKKADKALDSLLRQVPNVIAQTTGIPVNIKRILMSQFD